MSKYPIHSDFKKYENTKIPLSPMLLTFINEVMVSGFKRAKPKEGIIVTKKEIPGYQNRMTHLTIFEPEKVDEKAPCLIYFHGGAFVLKAAPHHKHLMCEYALKTPCKVIFVDYRLAPKYAFPVGVEECYGVLEWVYNNADSLGIDKGKIAVGGDSAGGAIAAAVSMMARDRKGPEICFQMLIYPVTDSRQITDSMKNFTDTPLWNSKLTEKMWELYLNDGCPINRAYAAPMEATSFENLPKAYVEVSEFDCLRDEGINYGEALLKGGCEVELNKTLGTVHGFEIEAKSELVRQIVKNRVEVLKKVFIERT
jgi:acetyl esterase/lipase